MLDLNKFSGKSKSEIFHSSGHAQLGHGSAIGAGESVAASQRQRGVSPTPRKVIGGYYQSKVGGQFGVGRVQQHSSLPTRTTREVSNRQAFNAGGSDTKSPPMKFKEPPMRGYNPYA